jgi:uncharacterized protein (DUF362 family)
MTDSGRPAFSVISRRPVLKLLLGSLAGPLFKPELAAAGDYRVGVGSSSDAYTATMRAVAASRDWPAARIAGQTVIIKTNLIMGMSTESGATTSAHVVRALVDLALQADAARVAIVEGGRRGSPFSPCGYNFFRDYDPFRRVSLVDLNFEPTTLAPVPSGYVYRSIYMPRLVLEPGAIFITAAKLKTHGETGATLSLKNQFGLPPIRPYFAPEQDEFRSRYRLHDRGVSQCIVDLNLLRTPDFAVVDGIWGMEGFGPVSGTPVRMDLVVAGRNALAVDRVCLDIMAVPQDRPQHLAYAAGRGLGPATMSPISVLGDAYTPRVFQPPIIPPPVWMPRVVPATFSPGAGDQTMISYKLGAPAQTSLEVLRTSDTNPDITLVRVLRNWALRPAGIETAMWDGRDGAGDIVPPGTYAIRARARLDETQMFSAGTAWAGVLA